jgi:hypothetical protein
MLKTDQVVRHEVERHGLEGLGLVEVAEDERLHRVRDVDVVTNGLFADGLETKKLSYWLGQFFQPSSFAKNILASKVWPILPMPFADIAILGLHL